MTKKNTFILLGLTATITITSFVIFSGIKKKRRILLHQREEVSDEGYETAHDILYPLKSQQWRKHKVKYH